LATTGREHIKWLPRARGNYIISKIGATAAATTAVGLEKQPREPQREPIRQLPVAIITAWATYRRRRGLSQARQGAPAVRPSVVPHRTCL